MSVAALTEADQSVSNTTATGPTAARGPMPSLAAIETHWEHLDRDELKAIFPEHRAPGIGWGEPFCFRCGWLAPVADYPVVERRLKHAGKLKGLDERAVRNRVYDATWNGASGWLQRAHLRDHYNGGTETPDNIVPMCLSCHDRMPTCRTRDEGIAYVNEDALVSIYLQMLTDRGGPQTVTDLRVKERRYWRCVRDSQEVTIQVLEAQLVAAAADGSITEPLTGRALGDQIGLAVCMNLAKTAV
jgi:hypothetical protein